MNLFLTAFNRLKKDGWIIALIDLAAILIAILMIVWLRDYIGGLLYSIEGFGTSLDSVSSNSINQTNLAEVIGNIQPMLFKYNLVVYFLFPLVLFLIIGVSQAISYGIANKRIKKVVDYRYMFKFLLFTLPTFILGIFLIANLIEILSVYLLPEIAGSMEEFLKLSKTTIFIAIIIMIVRYFTVISYGLLLDNNIKDSFNKAVKIGLRKFYLFIPLILIIPIGKLLFRLLFHIYDSGWAWDISLCEDIKCFAC